MRKKTKKKTIRHPSENNGVEYPPNCFATDTQTGKLDFFWRIPRERRIYYGHEEESYALIERLNSKKEQ